MEKTTMEIMLQLQKSIMNSTVAHLSIFSIVPLVLEFVEMYFLLSSFFRSYAEMLFYTVLKKFPFNILSLY